MNYLKLASTLAIAALAIAALAFEFIRYIKREYIDAPVRDSEYVDVPVEAGVVQAVATPEVSDAELAYLKRHHPGDASEAIRRATESRELDVPILWSPDELAEEDTEPSRPDAAE